MCIGIGTACSGQSCVVVCSYDIVVYMHSMMSAHDDALRKNVYVCMYSTYIRKSITSTSTCITLVVL